MENFVIITDLDGTLLHPATYSYDEATEALALIAERSIPLVLSSSKTRTEIELYRERLGNRHPFISENGGGIFIPRGYFEFDIGGAVEGGYSVITMGRPYAEIRKLFLKTRADLGIEARGFGDMTEEEISRLAALDLKEAALSKQREFDEPFIMKGEATERTTEFLKAIEASGLNWTRGRFYHILGDNNKGRAAVVLKTFFQKALGPVKTIGLGDGLNDVALLREVDYPVLVRQADGGYEQGVRVENLIRADGIGPRGWNSAVLEILKG